MEEFLKEKKERELEEIKISMMANIMYVRQKEPLGLGYAILIAEKFVGSEPFVVLLGDDIIINEIPATKSLIDVFSQTGDPVIGVMRVNPQEIKKIRCNKALHTQQSTRLCGGRSC